MRRAVIIVSALLLPLFLGTGCTYLPPTAGTNIQVVYGDLVENVTSYKHSKKHYCSVRRGGSLVVDGADELGVFALYTSPPGVVPTTQECSPESLLHLSPSAWMALAKYSANWAKNVSENSANEARKLRTFNQRLRKILSSDNG